MTVKRNVVDLGRSGAWTVEQPVDTNLSPLKLPAWHDNGNRDPRHQFHLKRAAEGLHALPKVGRWGSDLDGQQTRPPMSRPNKHGAI